MAICRHLAPLNSQESCAMLLLATGRERVVVSTSYYCRPPNVRSGTPAT